VEKLFAYNFHQQASPFFILQVTTYQTLEWFSRMENAFEDCHGLRRIVVLFRLITKKKFEWQNCQTRNRGFGKDIVAQQNELPITSLKVWLVACFLALLSIVGDISRRFVLVGTTELAVGPVIACYSRAQWLQNYHCCLAFTHQGSKASISFSADLVGRKICAVCKGLRCSGSSERPELEATECQSTT
jgi:hypothetical protein